MNPQRILTLVCRCNDLPMVTALVSDADSLHLADFSLEELGMRALEKLPRDKALDGIRAFNQMRYVLGSAQNYASQFNHEISDCTPLISHLDGTLLYVGMV